MRAMVRVSVLMRRLMETHFAGFGISGAQWAVLHALARAAEAGHRGLRVTELSEWLLVRPPSVTSVVSRLRRDGLVRCEVVPGDQRGRLLSLTHDGRTLVEQVLAEREEQIERLLSPLKERERETLALMLGRLADHFGSLTGESSCTLLDDPLHQVASHSTR